MTQRRLNKTRRIRAGVKPEPGGAQGKARRSWIRLSTAVLLALVGLCAATLSIYRGMRPRHPSAVARMAAETTPEVAALLHEADAVVRHLVSVFPTDPHAFHVLAWVHSRYGDTDQAVRYWEYCLTLEPGFDKAHHSIGVIVEAGGDHVRAAEHFRRAAEIDSESPVFPVYYARALTRQGKLEEGAEVLERFVRSHPSSVAALVTLGETYVQLGNFERAREILEVAVGLAPDLASPYYGLGTACARLGDLVVSKQYLAKFRELKARDEQIHRDDLQILDNIAQVRSDVAWVHTETGKVYLSHGDFSTGEEHLRRALELDESHVAGHRALAWLYEQQGQLEQAVNLLRSLAERVPDDLALLLNLGELCVRMAWFKEAEDAYRKAIESTPHNPGGYVALAGLHLKTGAHPAEARQLAEQAVSLDPRPSSYALLSAACQQCGDQTAALSAIDQALELEPGNPEYLALRATIRK